MSYIEYYKLKYGVDIKDDRQPLLVYRDKRNPEKITHLIPELVIFYSFLYLFFLQNR